MWAVMVAIGLGAASASQQRAPHTAPTPPADRPATPEPGSAPPDFGTPKPDEVPTTGDTHATGAHPPPEKQEDLSASSSALGVVGRVVRSDEQRITVRTDAGREIDLQRPSGTKGEEGQPQEGRHVQIGDRVHANYRVMGGTNELLHVEVITPAPPQ